MLADPQGRDSDSAADRLRAALFGCAPAASSTEGRLWVNTQRGPFAMPVPAEYVRAAAPTPIGLQRPEARSAIAAELFEAAQGILPDWLQVAGPLWWHPVPGARIGAPVPAAHVDTGALMLQELRQEPPAPPASPVPPSPPQVALAVAAPAMAARPRLFPTFGQAQTKPSIVKPVAAKARPAAAAKPKPVAAAKPAAKKRKAPKDPNKPKGARSAFSFFSAAEHKRLKTDRPELAFRDIAKEVAALWKALPATGRAPFAAQAAEDKKRHAEEMERYNKHG